MTYLILPSYGYQLICAISTLTTLALGCLIFLPIKFGGKIIIGLQLFLTALGLIGSLTWMCGFFGWDIGTRLQCSLLYLGIFGALAVCVRFFFIAFLPCFFINSIGSFIGFIIGAIIAGGFVCPFLWLNGLYIIYSNLFGFVSDRSNRFWLRISSLLLLLISSVPALNIFFHNQTLNFSSSIINKFFFEDVIIKQEVNNENIKSISQVTITGDLGSKSITAATTFGRQGILSAISSGAKRCSIMQFAITPEASFNPQTVAWRIHSCNTGDTTAQTYVNGALLTEQAQPLRNGAHIEVRRGKKTPVSLNLSIQTVSTLRKRQVQ